LKAATDQFEAVRNAVELSKDASGYEEYVMLCRARLLEPLSFKAYSEVLMLREYINQRFPKKRDIIET